LPLLLLRGRPQSTQASRVLALVLTGNAREDEDRRLQREGLMKAIDRMWRHPHIAISAASWVDSKLAELNTVKGEDYFQKISFLGKLDDTWISAWILSQSGLSSASLEAAVAQDPLFLGLLLVYG
ncbi:MAG: hypothetical protein ACKPKO_15530, partial [Candidatus Fonsibacter sp.]